jgi:hypothetical protein
MIAKDEISPNKNGLITLLSLHDLPDFIKEITVPDEDTVLPTWMGGTGSNTYERFVAHCGIMGGIESVDWFMMGAALLDSVLFMYFSKKKRIAEKNQAELRLKQEAAFPQGRELTGREPGRVTTRIVFRMNWGRLLLSGEGRWSSLYLEWVMQGWHLYIDHVS